MEKLGPRTIEALEQLRAMLASHGAESTQLHRLLTQLTHDLRSPLGSLGLDLFSLGGILEDLRGGMLAESDGEQLARKLETLKDIYTNMRSVQVALAEFLDVIDAAMDDDSPTGPE